ncbi:MAG: hypothetical protein LBH91_05035 [Prevotellaceae bacterium]|jgi:hypothetical protein|nr:hypothetical protein [Prevotellaceae bacterium]
MRKIQKISELQPTISFTEFEVFKDYGQSFLRSELGKLQVMLPLKSLSKELGLQESPLGRKTYFPPEGKVALMFLKSYSGVSDRDLVMQLNANIQ